MQMVHEMLSAAMTEDDSGNEEDKQEAARKADEGIAWLKAKLAKSKAEEAGHGQLATERGVDQEEDLNEPKEEGDAAPKAQDGDKEHQDGDMAQLKDQLKKREATVSSFFPARTSYVPPSNISLLDIEIRSGSSSRNARI